MSSRYLALTGFVLVVALALTQAAGFTPRAQAHGSQAAQNAASSPTPSVTPSPTPTPPSGKTLLSEAAQSSAKQGSVTEKGFSHSGKNYLYDGHQIWARFSWKHHVYRDHFVFKKPTHVGPARNVRDIRRVVVGPRVALQAHGHWYCSRSSLAANSVYWHAPLFTPKKPTTIGASQIGPHKVWVVKGSLVSQVLGGTGRFSVIVFVDQFDHLYRRVVDKGHIYFKGSRSTRVRSKLTYSGYGKWVKKRFPSACGS